MIDSNNFSPENSTKSSRKSMVVSLDTTTVNMVVLSRHSFCVTTTTNVSVVVPLLTRVNDLAGALFINGVATF